MPSFIASAVLFALAALPSALAAPTGIQPPFPTPLKFTGCPITALPDIPANQTLVSLTAGLKTQFVGLGMGVQNYTCSAAGTYVTAGAVATLYDVSCLVNTPLFKQLPSMAYAVSQRVAATAAITKQLGGPPIKLGEHIFVPNPNGVAGAISPFFDLTSSQKTPSSVLAAKVGDLPAPTGKDDVDYLELKRISGTIGAQVFRLDTKAGTPPASCTPGSPLISVPYAANYWFMH